MLTIQFSMQILPFLSIKLFLLLSISDNCKMLWKKESKQLNALFVDLFASNGGETWFRDCSRGMRGNPRKPVKNDNESSAKRNAGNAHFRNGRWVDALECYNDSLSLAKPGSENVSLAYANRAACFLKMKQYDECLNDIELAKKSGYPNHLMDKIDKRMNDCSKCMENGDSRSGLNQLKLSCEPDEKFPCMANSLKIERDQSGNSVVAREDIGIGETIVVEKVFHAYLLQYRAQKCNICLKSYTNLIPCDRCSSAMFCSEECRTNLLHEHECSLVCAEDSNINGSILNDTRGIILACNMFSSADELMDFVVQTIQSDPKKLPDSLSDDKSQYHAFLKLPTNEQLLDSNTLVFLTYHVYNMLQKIPKIDAMFRTLKHRRFLMHLVCAHVKIVDNNSVQGTFTNSFGQNVNWYNHIGFIENYFKHSCAPNVVTSERDGHRIFITVRPIKKGEQLTFSYYMFRLESTEKRQQILWDRKKMICSCTRCQGISASWEQRQQLTADPNYQKIVLDLSPMALVDKDEMQAMIDKCATFLKKYDNIEWCDEIGMVVFTYSLTLLRQKGLTTPATA